MYRNDFSTAQMASHATTRPTRVSETHAINRNNLSNGEYIQQVKDRAEDRIVDILEEIAPDGELQGNEYVMLNPHRNDGDLGSFKYNIDKHVFMDFADGEVKGSDIVGLLTFLERLKPMEAAQKINRIIDKFESTEQSESPADTMKVKNKVKAKPVKQITKPVIPVPEDAPPAPNNRTDFGVATTRYTYSDAEDRLVCHVHRFDPPGQRKVYLPQTYRKSEDGKLGWDWLGLGAQRPLYNLRELVTRPDAPALIVEGEKAANAAKILFPEKVVVTTMGGAQAPDKSDLIPLKGRSILLWPDNDDAGIKYIKSLSEMLRKQDPNADIAVIRIPVVRAETVGGQPVLTPGFIAPQGWDAADAVKEGWTAAHIELIQPADFLSLATEVNLPAATNLLPYDALISRMPDDVHNFVLQQFNGCLVYMGEAFFGYLAGYWRRLENAADVRNPIALFYGKDAKMSSIDSLFNLLQAFFAVSQAVFEPDKRMICMRNGTLNTDSYILENHSPDHGLVNKLDIDWHEDATCPRWLQFLDEVFVQDADKDQKISFLQQWFGYCLTPDVSQHKFVWMVGVGGNGKSVLLSILQQLVGPANVGHAQMERFDIGSVRAELEGKLLNISSEMSATATISDGYLKAITGGDSIEAERKYKQPHTFKPYVRLIAATNNLPRLLDNSDGFARRVVILTFNRKFNEQEKDPALEQTLLNELQGITAWAIEGLKRLRATGKLELPASSATELARYRTDSDPVALFAEECLVPSKSGGRTPAYTYDQYHEWSKRSGFQTLNKINFGKRLAALGFKKKRSGGLDYWMVDFSEIETFSSFTVKKEAVNACEVVPVENASESKPLNYKF